MNNYYINRYGFITYNLKELVIWVRASFVFRQHCFFFFLIYWTAVFISSQNIHRNCGEVMKNTILKIRITRISTQKRLVLQVFFSGKNTQEHQIKKNISVI